MIAKPSQGRVVLFVLPPGPEDPEPSTALRPAVIVAVQKTQAGLTCNLQVYVDGENDRARLQATDRAGFGQPVPPMVWRANVPYSAGREPGTWHWPPRD